jgi:GxxExxY protein
MEDQQSNKEIILYKEESYLIQGAIFEVYKNMGSGFLESVYQVCLRKEFSSRNIPFLEQPNIQISYKGEKLPLYFCPDFVCYKKIIVELKSVSELTGEHRAQLHNYLRISGMRLGLLVNFNHTPKVVIERIVL